MAQRRSGRPECAFSPRYILVRLRENWKPFSATRASAQVLSFITSTKTLLRRELRRKDSKISRSDRPSDATHGPTLSARDHLPPRANPFTVSPELRSRTDNSVSG